MTHGTIGGLLINYLILGRKNPLEKIYSPSRITLDTGVDYLTEMGSMVFNMAKGWLSSSDELKSEISNLRIGEGRVISKDLIKSLYIEMKMGIFTVAVLFVRI